MTIYQDTVNVPVKINVNIDMSKIIKSKFIVILPNGTRTEWYPEIDIENNQLVYYLQYGDIKIPGRYKAELWLELDTGAELWADPLTFVIKPHL